MKSLDRSYVDWLIINVFRVIGSYLLFLFCWEYELMVSNREIHVRSELESFSNLDWCNGLRHLHCEARFKLCSRSVCERVIHSSSIGLWSREWWLVSVNGLRDIFLDPRPYCVVNPIDLYSRLSCWRWRYNCFFLFLLSLSQITYCSEALRKKIVIGEDLWSKQVGDSSEFRL